MRTRIVLQVDPTQVGKEHEVRRELEGLGVEVERSESGSGLIVGHADQDALRKVGELRSVRSMNADATGELTGGGPWA